MSTMQGHGWIFALILAQPRAFWTNASMTPHEVDQAIGGWHVYLIASRPGESRPLPCHGKA